MHVPPCCEYKVPSDMPHPETKRLLDQAQLGNALATERLLALHRDRLCQIVAVLLDGRLSPRLDADDVVQDALLTALLRLPGYLKNRPVAFLPWLKSLAVREIVRVQRQHLYAQRRSVNREQQCGLPVAFDSVERLDINLAGREPAPGQLAIVRENWARVCQVLDRLKDSERTILLMRYSRQMTLPAIAAEMQIGVSAGKSRLRRARQSARRLLQGD